jgi:hypothetical protein
MVRILVAVFVLALLLTPFGNSSPLTGSFVEKPTVGPEPWSITKTFKGGERAGVLAVGGRAKDSIQIQLAVYDAKGALVVEDKGSGGTASVIWYPPRTGEYKVELTSPSKAAVKCYVAFK